MACTEEDFRLYCTNMGLNAAEVEAFVAVYDDVSRKQSAVACEV